MIMIKRLIKASTILLVLSAISSCNQKQVESPQYILEAPEFKDGVDIRYFQKRLDGENGHDYVDYMAIIYKEKNHYREETLYYY